MPVANPDSSVVAVERLACYHQHQENPVHCADYSIAMAYNIWLDRAGPAGGTHKGGPDVSLVIDRAPLGRFADGSTTPFGINYALARLGLPARWIPSGSPDLLRRTLCRGDLVVLSVGQLEALGAPHNWGHVKVAVGCVPAQNRFAFLDPGCTAAAIRWLSGAELSGEWWYPPFRLMWSIPLAPRSA